MTDGAPPTPIDPELAGLLERERAALPPAGALDRVWSRLAAVPVAGGGGAAAARGVSWVGSKVAAVAAAAFVAGAGLSAAAVMATVRGKERVVYVERPAPAAAELAKTPLPPPPIVIPLVASTPLPSAPSSAPVPASSLSRERALLDAARTALSSGDAARALSLLDAHARTFAKPQLGEEREALAIQALAASGRYDAARARAARLRATAPDSLFLPAIDATLGSIP